MTTLHHLCMKYQSEWFAYTVLEVQFLELIRWPRQRLQIRQTKGAEEMTYAGSGSDNQLIVA